MYIVCTEKENILAILSLATTLYASFNDFIMKYLFHEEITIRKMDQCNWVLTIGISLQVVYLLLYVKYGFFQFINLDYKIIFGI